MTFESEADLIVGFLGFVGVIMILMSVGFIANVVGSSTIFMAGSVGSILITGTECKNIGFIVVLFFFSILGISAVVTVNVTMVFTAIIGVDITTVFLFVIIIIFQFIYPFDNIVFTTTVGIIIKEFTVFKTCFLEKGKQCHRTPSYLHF